MTDDFFNVLTNNEITTNSEGKKVVTEYELIFKSKKNEYEIDESGKNLAVEVVVSSLDHTNIKREVSKVKVKPG